MSETKGAAMSETAVERRLREMAADWRQAQFPDKAAADDAGREAIVLLRVLLTLSELDYGDMSLFYAEEPEHPVTRAAALLARCEGE